MKSTTLSRALLASSIALALAGCNSSNSNDGGGHTLPLEECKTYQSAPEVIVLSDNENIERQTITIGATGDMHGRIFAYDYALDSVDVNAGFTKISTLLSEERAQNPNMIMIDLGDTLQGNSAELFNDLPVHPVVDTMNFMDYDLWVPGNHEFDFERSFLDKNIQAFEQAVISSNIVWDKNSDACATNGEEVPFLPSYQIFEIDGAKVAVVGLTPSWVTNWQASSPQNFRNLDFKNELESVRKAVEDATAKHQPDVVIGALHWGRKDGGTGVHKIATELADYFDVLFMGHEHAQFIERVEKDGDYTADQLNISVRDADGRPQNQVEDKNISERYHSANRHESVKVIEPGSWGWALAKAEIELYKDADGKWQIFDTTLANRTVADIEEDAALQQEMQEIHDASVIDANTQIGTVDGNFTFTGHVSKFGGDEAVHEDPQFDGATNRLYTTIHHAKVADMPLVDFINQTQIRVIEEKATDHNGNPVKVDVSAAALFGDSSNLTDGQVYLKKDSANLYMYDNMLVATEISGEQLQNFMEWSYSYFNTYQEGDITVSFNKDIRAYNYDLFDGQGFTYEVDIAQEPGNRVTITSIRGTEFDKDATYVIAVNDYRFSSTMVPNGWVSEEDELWNSADETVYAIRDMLTEYVAETGTLSAGEFTNQNWHIVQYGQTDAEGNLVGDKGALLKARETEEGSKLWQQLQNKEICVVREESRDSDITIAVNYKDGSTWYENPQPGTYQGCVH
ncbi:5'-nucleotidase C-terminal domain-containing protein [Photobacterium sp. BZF1]|uniref:bifunctional metallophosphatase/5'-nucleotidase n=1 Tax=Photobacterium sp. BZF1 TaxID=1904457 RepID=UPI001653622A|nr:5'-nucleotidase C-terminal domain-containing protein [Photobacterium sp. BZF1]MBC7001702.1 5'-nucleotidase C-terminal domain-containing protein [Photobacterium sp. BZF1]